MGVEDDNYSDEPLTAHEQAQFDAMRTGSEVPTDPAPADDQGNVADGTTKTADGTEQTTQVEQQHDEDPDIEVVDPQTNKKQKRVSLGKYQRVENRMKELERALQEATGKSREHEERATRIDERLRIINEALTTPAEEEGGQQTQQQTEVPDPEKDIFGYAKYVGQKLEAAERRISAFEDSGRQQQAMQELASTYQSDAARFAQTEPAFAAAYVHLIKQRAAELELNGITDEKVRNAQISREEQNLVRAALEAGQSPAERIFKMALGRGFQRPQATQQAAQTAQTGQQQQRAAPAAQQTRKDPNALDASGGNKPAASGAGIDVTAEIEAIKKGQAASTSLSNVGGGAALQELTSADLADMPEDQFNELLARLPKSRVRELMGD
jgi:hypothetical protein